MRIVEIIFSPTGGTAKVARAFAEGWEGEARTINLANPEKDFSTYARAAQHPAIWVDSPRT